MKTGTIKTLRLSRTGQNDYIIAGLNGNTAHPKGVETHAPQLRGADVPPLAGS